jgi:hypothetical protein
MGKISEYIIELGETYEEMLNQTGNVEDAKVRMADILSEDEFEFFNAHLDIIEENLDFTDGEEGPIEEDSGLKGDPLRPWGGRKRRDDMGYGKGGRANYDPADELDSKDEILRQDALMQDVEDAQMPPLTSEIIDDEEVFDVGSEDDWIYGKEGHADRMKARKEMLAKPPPVGTGGIDNVFDKAGRRLPENLEMPDLTEYFNSDRQDPDADSGKTINGEPVTWREYWKWYEEEGEFDDTEGREYRERRRF